jgi:demethylmenaquinone methyltransferase/2-methoxy-6-polyprenyl-1,4-benzoquinol methylase
MLSYRTVAGVFSQISGIYDRFLGIVSAGRIHRWQRDLLSLLGRGEALLDVGTGTGEVLIKGRDRFPSLRVGVDPSDGMLRVAKAKCGDCVFIQALGEELPFKEGIFDAVSLSLVFRHLQDQRAFLKEASRVLKGGGRIGILDVGRMRGTPLILFLMRTLLKPFGLVLFGRDKWEFFIHSIEVSHTPEEVAQLLEDSGFRVEGMERRLMGVIHIVVGVKTA